jgi:hypothetical protein
MLDESFLKSVTRNFSFSAYVRAGVQFNGSVNGTLTLAASTTVAR